MFRTVSPSGLILFILFFKSSYEVPIHYTSAEIHFTETEPNVGPCV